MRTNWQEYTVKDFHKLQGKQAKLNSGGVKTVSMIVGSSLYDNSHNEIDESDILFFAEKEDKTRYFKLQKHFETLSKFDDELLDDLEWAIIDITSSKFGDETSKKKS
jgi:hypothetical protein